MTERMLLEHLLEHFGFSVLIQMMEIICDAKAAEMAALGDMSAAKHWAMNATQLEGIQCVRH